ncbi:hypothetical protein F4780DRAFT_358917 [Xylariomycetidae sp. FL0641]|nr:hypothetical protein F4780DRAFT_358917 [Xylariomycetidae sp. FL0641]
MSPSTISDRSRSKSASSSSIYEIMTPANSASRSTPLPKRMASQQSLMEDTDHSTIPDPRIRAMTPAEERPGTSHHPDLDSEVATLSTKLINAINHQTTLDDSLSATRQELEAAHERVKELEETVAVQQEALSGDVWIKRKDAEAEKITLLARLAQEKVLRADVEKEKKKIEQELETLTVSLFEEANKMVYTAKEDAKKEHDALQRKNDQLKTQLSDTEALLKSQQEQLTELKLVMEQITSDHDDRSGTTPSSPGFSKFDSRDDDTQLTDATSHTGVFESFTPTYPTNLPHLVHPVLRTDLAQYDDFISLARTSKRVSSGRAYPGSSLGYGGLIGLGHNSASVASNASTASLTTMTTTTSSNTSPQSSHTPASSISGSSTVSSAQLPPLKETKFYKKVLAEDIEPTLRLDQAPGLSWLARRSVLTAMTEGTLVVEPVPTNSPFASISKPQNYPCSLCGESRKEEQHLRTHRFRTSESDSAQRYPLCPYCLGRVRSTCGFLGFLRMIKDGHWRANDADAEKAAWEESVRLRDQMFWSRIGGGFVPAQHGHLRSPSTSEPSTRLSHEEDGPALVTNKLAESLGPSLDFSTSQETVKEKPLLEEPRSEDTVKPEPRSEEPASQDTVKQETQVEEPTSQDTEKSDTQSEKSTSTEEMDATPIAETPEPSSKSETRDEAPVQKLDAEAANDAEAAEDAAEQRSYTIPGAFE